MVSPWLLLIPGAAAVYSVVKPSAPPRPAVPAAPVPQVAPGVPETPKTRAYAEAVTAVETVRRQGGSRTVFNGVSGWMADRTGRPMHPILPEKDLPAAPPGYRWSDYYEMSGPSRSAHTVHYWHLGPPPKGDVAPSTRPAPAVEVAPGVPATAKAIAYRNAERLKQYVEVRATAPPGSAFTTEIPGFVMEKDISESELPKPSPGFRWVRGSLPTSAGIFSTWQYVQPPAAEPTEKRWPTTGWIGPLVKPPPAPAGYKWFWISSTRDPNAPGFWNLVSIQAFSPIV